MPMTKIRLLQEIKDVFMELMWRLYNEEDEVERMVWIARYRLHIRQLLHDFLPPDQRMDCVLTMISFLIDHDANGY